MPNSGFPKKPVLNNNLYYVAMLDASITVLIIQELTSLLKP